MAQKIYKGVADASNKIKSKIHITKYVWFLTVLLITLSISTHARAAELLVGPTTGTFTVGSTFDVSLLLDTQGTNINAIELIAQFPSDKLQLVSPSTGNSIIGIWTSQPKFDNQTGTIYIQGVVPNGINVESGLITKLTFRVRSTGPAVIKILNTSKILAHNGTGEDVLEQTHAGVYTLVLPPPEGPLVVSETHPKQSTWYSQESAVVRWASITGVTGYSYMLSDNPVDVPDNISEGLETQVAYKNLPNKKHYFHLKALRSGVWGGTTHFVLNIDTKPPAHFSTEILPSSRTTQRQPIVEFFTTDTLSGVDYYELKLIPLTRSSLQTETETADSGTQLFFIEVTSPYILPTLKLGTYDIIIRVYDHAGNYQEVKEHLAIVTPFLKPIGEEGLEVLGAITIAWAWVVIIGVVLVALFGYGAWYFKKKHDQIHDKRAQQHLPEDITKKLDELKKYREKYGKTLLLLLLVGTLLIHTHTVFADNVTLNPPLVTSFSKDISNKEIFYVGGKTDIAEIEVILYIQNLETGGTLSKTTISDDHGNWFYRHDSFLLGGDYLLWMQSRIGEEESPPSPQMRMTVRKTAIQFGASRLSLEVLYFSISILLFIIAFGLAVYGAFYAYHARRKHKKFLIEIREVEESVRRGFAVLRRDIEAELSAHRKAKKALGGREPSDEEEEKEKQLIKDIEWAEQLIGKEIWDVKEVEQGNTQ